MDAATTSPVPRTLNKHHGATPQGAVYIGRGSPWGNPFVIGTHGDRNAVIARYQAWLGSQPELIARARRELAGKDLVCFCAPQRCHGDVLLAIANTLAADAEQAPAQHTWARHGGYEVSSHGDRRYSAFHARLRDGRTIEEVYQPALRAFDEICMTHTEGTRTVTMQSRSITQGERDRALLTAAATGNAELVRVVLSTGASPNAKMPASEWAPLHVAAANGHLDAAFALIEAGALVDAPSTSSDDRTPLFWAVVNDHVTLVDLLVRHGADVNRPARDTDGFTPLHVAARHGYRAMTEALIALGADLNATADGGATPLWLAAGHHNAAVVEALLASGADVDATGGDGNVVCTPLVAAILATGEFFGQESSYLLHGSPDDAAVPVVTLLSAAGASIFERARATHGGMSPGSTALHCAIQIGAAECATMLMRYGRSALDVSDDEGRTALHVAAASARSEAGEALALAVLDQGKHLVRTTQRNGKTPLHLAVEAGAERVCEALIDRCGGVNEPDVHGITPLHIAAFNANPNIVRLLVDADADPFVVSKINGWNAIDYAGRGLDPNPGPEEVASAREVLNLLRTHAASFAVTNRTHVPR